MKRYIVAFFAVMMIGFGVKGQNYFFTTSIVAPNGITVVFELETTGIVIVPNSSGNCNFDITYDYSVKFYDGGVEVNTNLPEVTFYDYRFLCGSETNYLPSLAPGESSGVTYGSIEVVGVTACNNLTLATASCNKLRFNISVDGLAIDTTLTGTSPLPIELINFDAYKKDRQVELSWKTASELNNDYFTIEKSVEGKSWEFLKTLNGAGNSSQISEYTVTDDSPYAGVSYYRLKQTDYDGATETFNIVSVEQNDVEELQAYPNPVSHTATILGINNDQEVRIFNTVGVEVTGKVIITSSPSKKTFVDMNQLPKGIYFIENGKGCVKLLKE
ncbi:T9SS type A sorting domain-containing protein [Brumimicrobium mesophilum]|uniref:T9SS type A sorting domain-containing protein n=1 Tax=Brumimicrobium mesophilum TaxID=392717 RepID=UPI000D142A5A|nr:T9SS type A sorting domain-containing protein [Brumimicrobium mesophilum]